MKCFGLKHCVLRVKRFVIMLRLNCSQFTGTLCFAGDLVAAGALYSQAISTYEDQNNLGYDYVRALQALGSIEAHARNARKARVLFMESIRAARQVLYTFVC